MIKICEDLAENTTLLKFSNARILTIDEAEIYLSGYGKGYGNKYYRNRWWVYWKSIDEPFRCSFIGNHGEISCYGDPITCDDIGVRPALIITNFEDTDFKIGDEFVINNKTFRIISNNLAWVCGRDIGTTYFDKNSNIYEGSHLEQYVNNWFKSEIEPYIK